jgi:hypothetical protein
MVSIFRAKLVATPADLREASLQIEKGCDGPIITKSTSWKGPESTASWSTNHRVLSPWEGPEEPSPGSTGPPPPGQAPSDVDSDMEEASVSSADDSMPGLISESDSEDELDHERPMTPPSPPPMRRFRFLGRLPPPPDQRGFRYLRQHARPRDIPKPPDPPNDVRVLIGPVRPVSPNSVALAHMINATGVTPLHHLVTECSIPVPL